MAWKCKSCGSFDDLEVIVQMWTKLVQEDPGTPEENFQTDSDEASEHDHEWGSDSSMRCMNTDCGNCGDIQTAEQFEVDGEEALPKETIWVSLLVPSQGADVYDGGRMERSDTEREALKDLYDWIRDGFGEDYPDNDGIRQALDASPRVYSWKVEEWKL